MNKMKTKIAGIIFLGFIFLSFSSKEIENRLIKVDEMLYASKFELTNKEYRDFLSYLKTSNNLEKYNNCLYDSTKWIIDNSSFLVPLEKTYHWHPAYDNYPVVNITQKAAELYCEWLTDQYNSSPKRIYKKVLFRLPTEIEWKRIANPLPDNVLPWYGGFAYDQNGVYLANVKFRRLESNGVVLTDDGGLNQVMVGTYKANKLGAYDVIGNVCEMTQEGSILGGSWDNFVGECGIDKSQNYNLPDPRVGFRFVMEVIEK